MKTFKKLFQIKYVIIMILLLISCEKDEILLKDTSASDTIEEKQVNYSYTYTDLNFRLEEDTHDLGGFAGHQVVRFKDRFWLVGGDNSHTPPWKSSNQIWSSPDGKVWEFVTDGIFAERRNHSLLVYKDRLWLIGGIDNANTILSDIWVSKNGLDWTEVKSLNPLIDIGQNNSIVFNNKIYVFRGNGTIHQEVWSTIDGATWNLETDNAFPVRSHYKTVTQNGFIYVIGGWIRGSKFTNEVWASYDGRYWFQKPSATATFGPRINHTATSFDGKIWVLGGENADKSGGRIFYNDIWYSSDMKYWKKYKGNNPFKDGLHSHSSLVYKNRLWTFGGYVPYPDMSDKLSSLIWSMD